jgi:hypothetical protein
MDHANFGSITLDQIVLRGLIQFMYRYSVNFITQTSMSWLR